MSIAQTIASNLPAILQAAAPIVASLGAVAIAWIARRDAKKATADVAQTKAATNRLIDVSHALYNKTYNVRPLSKASEPVKPFPTIPEKLQ
jgi:hypothetical protein